MKEYHEIRKYKNRFECMISNTFSKLIFIEACDKF